MSESRKKPDVQFLVFIGFALVYVILINKFLPTGIYTNLAAGVFVIIAGVWGLLAGMVFIKIPYSERYSKIVNLIFITIGAAIVFYYYFHRL